MIEFIFKPHSEKQERALLSKKRILLLATGTQYGKTTVGAIRMKLKMLEHRNKDDHFLITAPTYKVLNQSTLPAFLSQMSQYGSYNKKEDVFEMNRGGRAFFRTETDPDSIIGITNVKHVWGDEAGKYRLYFWENIQARADFFGCSIDLTTSPYSLNWIWKDLIKPYQKGIRQDIEYIAASSWENPYHSLHDPIKRQEKEAVMDPRRFKMLYGGEFEKMEGLVYDCFSDEENQIESFKLPPGTRYFAGIDWGFTDPFVIKVRAVTPDKRHYGVSEYYRTQMTVSDVVDIVKQKYAIFNWEKLVCDPSRPEYIAELNRFNLKAVGADNDIRLGIDRHYELIKSRRYKLFRGSSPHTLDEYETYHYPEPKDLRPDQASKDNLPVDKDNHALDVERYITNATYSVEEKKAPIEPGGDKQYKTRLDFLKRSRLKKGTETWS